MKIALYGLHRGSSADPRTMARRARLAEEAGFEGLWVGDHIALPAGAEDPAEQARIEAVVALAHLAALTTRIGLGFGVIVLPQRQPVLLAKQLTSIDVLSGGRLTVGVGVGWIEPELRALGASLSDRAARTDEYLAAMRALWDEPTPAFDGRFVSFDGVLQRPLPVQRPHPPIVIGGRVAGRPPPGRAVRKRLVRLGPHARADRDRHRRHPRLGPASGRAGRVGDHRHPARPARSRPGPPLRRGWRAPARRPAVHYGRRGDRRSDHRDRGDHRPAVDVETRVLAPTRW